MSPRSYEGCPQCKKQRKARSDKDRQELGGKYGKIPMEAFKEECRRLDENDAEFAPETLEEYYEWEFNDEGFFTLRYDAGCRICGFKFETKFAKDAEIKG